MKVNNILQKYAVNQWQVKKFLQEWQVVILVCIIIKLFTFIISILCGVQFLENIYFKALNKPILASFCSWLTLIILETINAYLIAKFYKYALRLKLIIASILLLFCGATFGTSFYISCQGVAIYQAKEQDNSEEINSYYNLMQEQAEQDFNNLKKDFENKINDIKENPSIWQGGRRCKLSDEQLSIIKSYNDEIIKARAELKEQKALIKEEHEGKLIENNKNTSDTAKEFYNIVAVIMFVQFVVNGVLMFFYSKITKDTAEEIIFKEHINEIDENILSAIASRTKSTFDNYLTKINQDFKILEVQAQPINTATTGESLHQGEQESKTKIKGFAVEQHAPENSDTKSVYNICKCEECGKEFAPKRKNQRFCSAEHRVLNYNKTHEKQITINKNFR